MPHIARSGNSAETASATGTATPQMNRPPTGEVETAGPTIAGFVVGLVASEDARRTSLEARGAAVITSSGGLVTLVLGIGALVTKSSQFTLTGGAQDRVGYSVLAFVLAALFAAMTYVPQGYDVTDPDALRRALDTRWAQPADSELLVITGKRLEQLSQAQRVNDRKASALFAAMLTQ